MSTAEQDAFVNDAFGVNPAHYPKSGAAPSGGGGVPNLTSVFGNRAQTRTLMIKFDAIIKVNPHWCLMNGKKTKIEEAIGGVKHQLDGAIGRMTGMVAAGVAEADGLIRTEESSFFLRVSEKFGRTNAKKVAGVAKGHLATAAAKLGEAHKAFEAWHYTVGYETFCFAIDEMQAASVACLQWSEKVSSAAGTTVEVLKTTRDSCIATLVVLTPMAAGAELAVAATATGAFLEGGAHASDAYFEGKPIPWASITIEILFSILFKGFEGPIKAKMVGFLGPLKQKYVLQLVEKEHISAETAEKIVEWAAEKMAGGLQAVVKALANAIFAHAPKNAAVTQKTMKETVEHFFTLDFVGGLLKNLIPAAAAAVIKKSVDISKLH